MGDVQTAVVFMFIGFALVFLLVLALLIVASHFVARAARMKNRSYASFFWLSILISPLTTGLVVAILPFNADDPRHPKNKAAASGLLSFTNN
jgi:ABC-type iron transport system FetAB permease component